MTTSEMFTHKPSSIAYMARAFLPSAGLESTQAIPAICEMWADLRIDREHYREFLRLTGLSEVQGGWVLYPHVFGFRLHMALLTHRRYPLPIWSALQIRNQLVLHKPLRVDGVYQLETRVAGQRRLEKGLEVDLYTSLHEGSELCWESTVTFYYRGRYGKPDAPSGQALSPVVEGPQVAEWTLPEEGGWAFGGLTGDYNGIHCWHWYARRFGFKAAFAHPQRVAGACLAHLPARNSVPQRLDLWLKGTAFYGSKLQLRAAHTSAAESCFALYLADDSRPAIIGHWADLAPATPRTGIHAK